MFSNIIDLPTKFGLFKCFAITEGNKEHLILFKGDIENKECLVRIHSECLTGDLFGSKKCDCGDQLDNAMKTISKESGILIYLRQEGRGIGLFNKIEAYKLQSEGLDTVQANIELGLPIDNRKYTVAIKAIEKLNPSKVKLITNNPDKLKALSDALSINVERIPSYSIQEELNKKYIETKYLKMNHIRRDT
jgi:3,4-dihydroxy 2-butanone 4-phosphate synthase / GTP cyclohydrolase II